MAVPVSSIDDLVISWTHAGALVEHANRLRLIEESRGTTARDRIRFGLQELAGSHPWLEGLLDPRTVPLWNDEYSDFNVAAVEDHWRAAPLLGPNGTDILGFALGDEYQSVSATARKQRALCQTPRYVAELLYDLALSPALKETGPETRIIDPACGTGHLVVGAAVRAWSNPWANSSSRGEHFMARISPEEAVTMVSGVDIDPYATLLTRYRLLTFVARANAGTERLAATAQDLPEQVVCADSLLDDHPVLRRKSYEVVVANPPYITPRDAKQNEAIRKRYPQVCHGKYSLALPFFQLTNDLAVQGGRVAQLTANSFMKREFGKKFVESYLPYRDLRWIIDTSGAYIPGHGTPTVILMHRNRFPTGNVSVVMGNKGEPQRPDDPAKGVVWLEISSAVRDSLSMQKLREAVAPPEDVVKEHVVANQVAINSVGDQLALFPDF